MFFTYLRRELAGRRRQTAIVAAGMALAIALVMIVNSVAAGVRDAQAAVLESVYGVGTDLTVSQAAAAPGEDDGGPGVRFEFGADDGATTADGATELSTSRLTVERGTATFDASALDTAQGVDGVAAASATLTLANVTFDGELPEPPSGDDATAGGDVAMPAPGEDAGGFGGGAFDVSTTTVTGVGPGADALGPLSSVELVDGRSLEAGDAGSAVVVLDADHATSEGLAVGDTIDLGGTDFEVIGTVASTSADATTATNAYIPLDTAQELAGVEGQVTGIAVQAESADLIGDVRADLEAALPDQVVSTQEDLAASVSGSLGSASQLISSLGLWLSVAVLAAAFLIAILFTIQGVTRRTREFGTLKAIGWSNRRITGQVAGESLVQGLVGGAAGLALGFLGIGVVNAIAPTLATTSVSEDTAAGPMGGGFAGAPSPFDVQATEVVLTAPVTAAVVALAVGLAVLGGLLAGAIGGWRASRLRPAEALRSVA